MIKTFIIHVSKGYEDRRAHIDTHLPEIGITEYEYMLQGDIDDLSDDIRNDFFGEKLNLPQMSCLYKHYLVMKKVVDEGIEQALVLEDDALLHPEFIANLAKIQQELGREKNYLVNIEEASSLVPISLRESNKHLYLCKTNKLTGGLIYDLGFAQKMVKYIEKTVIDAPIDGLIGNVRDEVQYNIFWVHPPLVRQGSKSGLFTSELSNEKAGIASAIRNWCKDTYRMHILGNLRKKHRALFENINKY